MSEGSTRRWEGLALVCLAGAALALRAAHLDWGFPEIYEEATPVREAVGFWGKAGQGLDLNPHFFKYPSFSFYLNFGIQAIAYLWLSISGAVASLADFRQMLALDLPPFVLLGRWLSAILGALVVVPTALLARELGGRGAGIAAGLLVAAAPLAVAESRLVAPDILLLLLGTACLVSATRWARTGAAGDALAGGIWMGLAAAAKYPGALLAVALLTAHAIEAHRRGAGPLGLVLSNRIVQVLAVAALAFAVASPYVLLDFPRAIEDINFERRHMAIGHLGREEGRAWGYYLLDALPAGLTLPLGLAALAGGMLLLLDRKRRNLALPGILFAAVTLLVLGSWRMAAPRYALPIVSVAAAWAGVAAVRIPALWPRRLASRARIPMAAALFVALFLPALVESLRHVEGEARPDSRAAARTWIEENVPEGSAILVERYGPEPDPSRFAVIYMPFHAVTPHLYDLAYVSALYSEFDVVVFSSGVAARYLADFREYPFQASFYRAMESGFEEVASFPPGRFTGPEIRVLRRREDVRLPDLDTLPADFFSSQKGNGPLAEYLSGLGTVLVRRGRDRTGYRLLEEAVAMDPGNAKAWGNLGSMRLRAGRLEESLAAYRRALEVAPGDSQVWYNLGTLYDRMGEPRQARDAFQEAIARDATLEDAYLGLARALVQIDNYSAARAVLRGFLERFPRSAKRAQAESALEELRLMGPGRQ